MKKNILLGLAACVLLGLAVYFGIANFGIIEFTKMVNEDNILLFMPAIIWMTLEYALVCGAVTAVLYMSKELKKFRDVGFISIVIMGPCLLFSTAVILINFGFVFKLIEIIVGWSVSGTVMIIVGVLFEVCTPSESETEEE